MMIRSLLRGPAAFCALAAALFAGAGARRQTTANGFDLSVRNIMRGPELVGRSPDEVRFSATTGAGSTSAGARRRPATRPRTSTASPPAAARRRCWPTPWPTASPRAMGDGGWTPDRTRRAFARLGDVYVTDVSGNERRITQTPARETGPELSADGRTVYWFSNNNIYADARWRAARCASSPTSALDAAPRDPRWRASAAPCARQQTELFDVVRDREEQRERARAAGLAADRGAARVHRQERVRSTSGTCRPAAATCC